MKLLQAYLLIFLILSVTLLQTTNSDPARRKGIKVSGVGVKGPLGGSAGKVKVKIGNTKIVAKGVKGPLGGSAGSIKIKKRG